MRILYYGQHSMRTYSDPISYALDKDGALHRQLARIAVLPKSYRWDLVLPITADQHGGLLPPEFHKLRNDGYDIKVHYYVAPFNVMTQRFETPSTRPFEEIKNVDVMLCEMPEHVGFFRMMQENKVLPEFPIVTKVLHVELFDDTKPVLPYFWRQLEGISLSDHVVFPLRGIYEAFKAHAHALLSPLAIKMLDRPTTIWNGMFTPKLLGPNKRAGSFDSNAPITFAFISRLSDDKRTKAAAFLEAMTVFKPGAEAQLWVADPTDMMGVKDFEHKELVFGKFGNTREDYVHTLRDVSDVVPILYDQGLIASIGFCEAAWFRNVMVHPYSKAPDNLNGIGVQYDVPEDKTKMSKVIEAALVEAFEGILDGSHDNGSHDVEMIYDRRSTDVEAEKMQEDLESVVF